VSVEPRRLANGERRYDVRLRRPDGSTYMKTFRTRKEAEAFERSERTARDRGQWNDPRQGTIPLSTYAATWLEGRTVRGRPLAPRTAESYRYLFRSRIEPTFGAVFLNKIDPPAVRAWHSRLARSEAPSVAPKAYRLLHAIFVTAVDDGLVPANPCRIKGAGMEHHEERPMLGVEDVMRLADAIDRRWRALVLVAAFGGLRFGELLALRRRDIDLESARLTIAEQVVELSNGRHVRTRPKSAAGVRTIYLPAFVGHELADHLAAFVETDPESPVFTGAREGIPTRRNWSRIWGRTREKAGLPGTIHLHDLRHAGATLAAQSGATTRELMARLGHASPRAALIYQHAAEDRDQAIAVALDRLICG
jgi:integrase